MKNCKFYKNERRISCDWIRTSEDCVHATFPRIAWRARDAQGWVYKALHCCHFFRNRTMMSSSANLWGFRERKQGLQSFGTRAGPGTSDPEDWFPTTKGIGGSRQEMTSGRRLHAEARQEFGTADVRMSPPATAHGLSSSAVLGLARLFLPPFWLLTDQPSSRVKHPTLMCHAALGASRKSFLPSSLGPRIHYISVLGPGPTSIGASGSSTPCLVRPSPAAYIEKPIRHIG